MIRVLYGGDTYSRTRAFERLRAEMADEGADIVRFDASVAISELLSAAQTLPFLAPRRLVVVDGLLTRAQPPRRTRGGGRRSAGGKRSGDGAPFWAALADAARDIPPTTELVLLDELVDADNPLLRALAPEAEVREFRPLAHRDLPGWIIANGREAGLRIPQDAARLLADLCGSNLWAASAEIEKLRLYAGERAVTVDDVRALAASIREESVFAMVDAVVEGRPGEALRRLNELRDEGHAAPYIITMIARQYRLLILARELAAGGVASPDIGRRLGVTNEFALRKTVQQASRANMPSLEAAMRRLLEADLALKRGEIGEALAVELLVADLAVR